MTERVDVAEWLRIHTGWRVSVARIFGVKCPPQDSQFALKASDNFSLMNSLRSSRFRSSVR